MVDVHYITDGRCYSFESDNENNINGYELSDLSDIFEDDSIDIKKAVQNQLQSLTLDDIPYDRDVNYINIPSSTRQKSLLRNVPNRLFQQVRTIITEGNVEEIGKLDRHFAALDQTKREYDRRSLFTDKKDDGGFRGGNTKKKRSRKPKNDNKESLPEEDPIDEDKMNDYEYERANRNQCEGNHKSKTREMKKQTSNAHRGDESQNFAKVKTSGRIQSDGAMNDSSYSPGGPSRQHKQKAVHPHFTDADQHEEDAALQAQGNPIAQDDYEEYDVDGHNDQPGFNLNPVPFRAIPSDSEKDRNSFRIPQPRNNHGDVQKLPPDSQLYSHPPEEEGPIYYSAEPLSRSIVSTKEYAALGYDSHTSTPSYHKSSSRPGNYTEFKVGNGRRYPPQSDTTLFSASTSKNTHRSHYKSSPDPALSLQHSQYAQQQQYIPVNNKSSYKAGQQQRHDGKKLHGRHGYQTTGPSDLQGNHYDDEDGTELSMGFDAAGYGHSPQHFDMDARAGRHFSQQVAVAEADVPPPPQQQRRQPYPQNGKSDRNRKHWIRYINDINNRLFVYGFLCDVLGSDYRPYRTFQGASSALAAPQTAKQQRPPQPLRPTAAHFAPSSQATAGESPPFQDSDPNANSNPSQANDFKLNPSAKEWVPWVPIPKFRPR
jgi:hypothetical protein